MSVLRCGKCNDRGLLAIGNAVQYCMCSIGRAKKREWFSHPADDRREFDLSLGKIQTMNLTGNPAAKPGHGSRHCPTRKTS